MKMQLRRSFHQHLLLIASMLVMIASCSAQQPDGPQSDAPPPVAPKPAQQPPVKKSSFLRERESASFSRTASPRTAPKPATPFIFKLPSRLPRTTAS
jgi:hypothetical protein